MGEVADFDAEADADGDLNDSAAAAHDGAVGLEFTFDDANVAQGASTLLAANALTGVIPLWFHPNTLKLEVGKVITLVYAIDGAVNPIFGLQIQNTAGQYQIASWYIDDAAAWHIGTFYDISTAYHQILLFWGASTGANDGFIRLFMDMELIDSVTDCDNDTLDWDAAYFGMVGTTSTTFGGSFYMDTIKIDPVGAPFADKLAAVEGDYGIAIPIMDNTPRYVMFNGPVSDRLGIWEKQINVDYLTMAAVSYTHLTLPTTPYV